jgi:hypothetical protein
MIWRWSLVFVLLLIMFWFAQLTIGYLWAASALPRPGFNSDIYLRYAGYSTMVFFVVLVIWVLLCISIYKRIRSKSSFKTTDR